MASIIVTIGREINGPYEGTRIGKAYGQREVGYTVGSYEPVKVR